MCVFSLQGPEPRGRGWCYVMFVQLGGTAPLDRGHSGGGAEGWPVQPCGTRCLLPWDVLQHSVVLRSDKAPCAQHRPGTQEGRERTVAVAQSDH